MAPGKSTVSMIFLTGFAVFLLFAFFMIGFKLVKPLTDPRWYLNEKKNTADIIDFFQYYQASDLAHSSQSKQVYEPEVQKQWTRALISPYKTEKIFYNQQPPVSYVLLWPLSLLPANISYFLFCLGQLIFGGFCLNLLTRLGPLDKQGRAFFIAGVIASFPSYILIWHGNTTYWFLGLLALTIFLLYQQKDFWAGFTLALAMFKPQYLFPLITPIAAMKRYRAIFGLVAMEALLLLLAIPIIGLDNLINYPSIVLSAESNPDFIGVNANKMLSVRGLFAQFVSTKMSLELAAATMFLSLPLLFIIVKKVTLNPSPDKLRWLWAFSICLMVLVSPHSHLFDFLLLSTAAALTLPTVSISDIEKLPVSLRFWTILWIIFPPASWIANYTIGKDLAPVFFFFPYTLVLFLVSALRLKEETAR